MSDEPNQGDNRRAKPRISVRFRAEYRGWNLEGSGVVRNVSETGALIDPAQPLLVEGGQIKLLFSFFEDSLPVEIGAVVARETKTGFGVRFTGLNARIRAVLAMAIAKARAKGHPLYEETKVLDDDDDDDDVTLMGLPKRNS